MENAPLIAIDTNALMDLAVGNETLIDCFDTIRKRIPKAVIMVPPTVLAELSDILMKMTRMRMTGMRR